MACICDSLVLQLQVCGVAVDPWCGCKAYYTWLDKQERACAAVRSRLGYNAREEVKDKAVLDEVFLGLKKRFHPPSSAIFQHLDWQYHELTLAECKGVSTLLKT